MRGGALFPWIIAVTVAAVVAIGMLAQYPDEPARAVAAVVIVGSVAGMIWLFLQRPKARRGPADTVALAGLGTVMLIVVATVLTGNRVGEWLYALVIPFGGAFVIALWMERQSKRR